MSQQAYVGARSLDGGRAFRRYVVGELDGYWPRKLHVSGGDVTIVADPGGRGRAATIRVA